jgi:hypothetical protein
MASYDDGKELEDRGATEDDLAYKADYEEHQDVIELLDKCQQADKDNRERVREAHLVPWISVTVSGSPTGGTQ